MCGGRRPVDLDDLTFAYPERLGELAGLRPFFACGCTTVMNATFACAFTRRVAGAAVRVSSVHPE